jgi:hypothetical protein
VNRYSGRSCFDLFHEADSLFDPCCEEAQEAVHVRAHTNRTLPPSRRRVVTASSGHADISAATSCNEDAAFCESEKEEMAIPENSSSDDADKNAKHPAIRRRAATKAIAIPRRRTRQSYFILTKMVLSVYSELAAVIMVMIKFNKEHLVRKIFEYQLCAGNFGEFCPSTGVFPLGQTRK